jgi:nucleotide-binding universal stress UspA family protein
MAYKSITIVITDDAADHAALDAAVGIALREGAHLDIHCIGIDPARYDAMPMGAAPVMLETAAAEARERAEALAAWAKGRLPPELVRVGVQAVAIPQLGLDAVVARLARYADLVVAGKPYGAGRGPLQVSVVESALFGTDAAVLIVPERATDWSRPFARVAVAWNESDEAMAAIRKAIPMLQAAQAVDVVMVDPPAHSPERSDPGGALCLMLVRHGIRAEVSILARTMPRASDVILRFAREVGDEAIVMGAYGHSRLREAILGGATRDLLETADLPLLMAH